MNNKTKLFVIYSDFLKCGLNEKEETHLLYSCFVEFKKTVYIDPEKFLYNINGYYLDKISTQDDLSTKNYYSPIPFSLLTNIIKDLKINYQFTNNNQIDKKNIVDILTDANYSFQTLLKKLRSNELKYKLCNLFKPKCESDIIVFNDFSKHFARNNDLELFEQTKDLNSYTNIWLSNKSLLAFIRPFVTDSDYHYIGVIHLRDFDNIKLEYMEDMYSRHKIKTKLEYIIKNTKQRYILALVSSNEHWSSLCYDKYKKYIYYFNSNGNLPTLYASRNNYYFYCFINQFQKNKTCHLDKTHRYFKPIEMMLDTFNAKSVFLNLNTSQLYSGFCGIFSIIFILLNILHPIEHCNEIKKIYSFFRFKNDYSMSLFRKMFFSNKDDYSLLFEKLNEDEVNKLKILKVSSLINKFDDPKITIKPLI